MSRLWKTLMPLVFLTVTAFTVASCGGPAVSPEEYDRLSRELNTAQSQLAELQGKLTGLATAQAQYSDLSTKYNALQSQLQSLQSQYDALNQKYEAAITAKDAVQARYDDLNKEYDTLQDELDALQDRYDELSRKYEEAVSGVAAQEITEEEVEQAIFNLVNQERIRRGLAASLWGVNLYGWAKTNSRNMATNKVIEYSDYSSWQDVQWVTGYSTTERMANAVFTIWQNGLQYERNFLNQNATYCAVGVHKSGEIFYITYIASPFR